MKNQKTIIEMEAEISALKKQLKNIARESKTKEERLNSVINELTNENNRLLALLKLSKKNNTHTFKVVCSRNIFPIASLSCVGCN